MKIDSVDAWWVQIPIPESKRHVSDFGSVATFDALVVRVETDTGIVGFGEGKNAAGSAGTYAALRTLVTAEMGPRLLGRDPLQIGPIWSDLYNGVRATHAATRGHVFPELSRRGLTIAAISAIDLALWDILGKSLGVPVWQLLGGSKATRMPAYASGGWAAADQIGEQLAGYIDQGGFPAVKMRVGAMDGQVHVSAERVIAARERLGPEVELMCDAHGTFTVSEAKRFCHMIRDCDLTWFEEPVSSDDKPGLAEVRRSSHVPIATGESDYTRFDFRDLIDLRAADVLQPDLAVCGGISEAVRISALAATYNLQFVPHLWAGALAFAAGLHVAAASPASRILEYSVGANPMLHDLVEEEWTVVDGTLAIPEAPGLGVTVREDVIAKYAVQA